MDYYLTNAAALSAEVGYIALPARAYDLAKARLAGRVTGTLFGTGSNVGIAIDALMAKESAP